MSTIKSTGTENLSSIINDLKRGNFVIPDFQREFEWEAWDVNDLVKSIFQEYYIGTLLFWEVKNNNTETLACEPIRGIEKTGREKYIVLDGQQRLTAMYTAFFSPDVSLSHKKSKKATFYVNVQKLESEFEEEAFTYDFSKRKEDYFDVELNQFEEHIFPLKTFGKGIGEIFMWLSSYKKHWSDKKTEDETLNEEIDEILVNIDKFSSRINQITESYKIAFIELDGDIDIKKVCDIFTKINSKGVKLDIFDLLNAILKPHEIRLKELWRKKSEEITYSNDSKLKIYVLQIMSIWLQNYCSPKYLYYLVPNAIKQIRKKDGSMESLSLIDSKDEFINWWRKSEKSLEKSFNVLSNSKEYGAIKSNFLPYSTLVPLFSAISYEIDNNNEYQDKVTCKKNLKLFYWSVVFTQNYSSSTESKSARDFVALKKWFKNPDYKIDVIEEFKDNYKNLKLATERSVSSSIYKGILNLLVLNNCRDFKTYDLTDYSELDDHHIVPNSWGRKNNIESINSILNRTLITSDSNRKTLGSKLPNVYIQEMIDANGRDETINLLKSHFISEKGMNILLKNPFTSEDFESYIEERKKSIIEGLESIILKGETPIEDLKSNELWSQLDTIENKIRDIVNTKLSEVSENPYDEFFNDNAKAEVEKKIFSEMKKHPNLSFSDFESFDKKLANTSFGELSEKLIAKKSWIHFEPIFKNKAELSKRITQLLPFRNKYAHNNESNSINLYDAKASIDWFNEVLEL